MRLLPCLMPYPWVPFELLGPSGQALVQWKSLLEKSNQQNASNLNPAAFAHPRHPTVCGCVGKARSRSEEQHKRDAFSLEHWFSTWGLKALRNPRVASKCSKITPQKADCFSYSRRLKTTGLGEPPLWSHSADWHRWASPLHILCTAFV